MVGICENRIANEFRKSEPPLGNLALREETYVIIKDCIAYSDDINSERLTELVRIYQILLARSRTIRQKQLVEHQGAFEEGEYSQMRHVVDWATLRAISELLFGFARGTREEYARDELPSRVESYFHFAHAQGGPVNFDEYPRFCSEMKAICAKRIGQFFDPDWINRR
jgi:hypothetical protein